MNKHLSVWGLLVFIGFLATQYLYFTLYDSTYIIPLWIILAVIGAAFCCMSCNCKNGILGKKSILGNKGILGKKAKCCCCCSGTMAFAAGVGIILTAAILLQVLAISPFYIISVWMIAAGSAFVAKGLGGRPVKLQLGLLWLFSAVFFPFVNNYQGSALMMGALVVGVPLMLAGILEKE